MKNFKTIHTFGMVVRDIIDILRPNLRKERFCAIIGSMQAFYGKGKGFR